VALDGRAAARRGVNDSMNGAPARRIAAGAR